MAEKQLTEKQHFVPQFYLRSFANSDKELYRFNTKTRKAMRPKGAGGICHDQFFYAAETGKPDEISQEIEDFFSRQVEDPLSIELPKIIDKISKNQQISESEKYTLALFMNTMWLRNPAMRRQINDMEEKAIKWMNKMRYSHPSIDQELDELVKEQGWSLTTAEREEMKQMVINEKYDIKFSNASHLRFMLDAEHIQGFANLFFGQHWLVHISKCDRQFITSDNPITVIFPKQMGFYGATFLERTHLFPITPHILIEARYPRHDTGKKIKRNTIFKGSERIVDEFNLKIASQAEFIYASRQAEIDWFVDYAKKVGQYEIRRLMSGL